MDGIFLLGPTGIGKTAFAVDLVKRFPMEIVSVDSAMVYRGMDIGTAKPDAEVLASAPHHLIDLLDPAEIYSAADFQRDAVQLIEEIHQRGRIPLFVGGTMLYFKALEEGLSPLPSSDSAVRRTLIRRVAEVGLQDLYAELLKIDPDTAGRIHPNDSQRLQRALEVYYLTGKPMSVLQKTAASPTYQFMKLGLWPEDREELRQQLAMRFDAMLQQGFIEEVSMLFQRPDLHRDKPSMRAVGYRQIWAYLEGRLDFAAMRDRAVIATRQLAKRQLTWMRRDETLKTITSLSKSTRSQIDGLIGTLLDQKTL